MTATDDYLKEGSESLIATITGVTDTDSRYEAVAIGSSNVANSAITDEATPAAADTVYAQYQCVDAASVAEGGALTYTVTFERQQWQCSDSTSWQQCSGCSELSGVATAGVDTSALPSSVMTSGGTSSTTSR